MELTTTSSIIGIPGSLFAPPITFSLPPSVCRSGIPKHSFAYCKSGFAITTMTSKPIPHPKYTPFNSGTAPTNMSSTPIILTKFALFPKLPVLLQDMIWAYSMLDLPARIVEVEYSTTEGKILSPTLPSPFLHACTDSRRVARAQFSPLSFGHFSGAFINWEKDTLMLNIGEPGFFSEELNTVDCSDMYRKCQSLIVNAGTEPHQAFFDSGAMTRARKRWVHDPTSSENGYYEEYDLFEFFEKLSKISFTYLGKAPKGEGNLTVEMASDDILADGVSAPRPGSTRYRITRLGHTFPSQELVDQSIDSVANARIVKLARGKERKITKAARIKRDYLRQVRKLDEFRLAKMAMDEVYEMSFGEEGDEDWQGKMERWAEAIPAGSRFGFVA